MIRRAALLLASALALVAPPASAGAREDVAHAYAPVFFQETNDPVKDLLTAYDFDGNWNGDDNAENMECWSDSAKCTTTDNPTGACAGQKCPLVATVYFTVIETATHWFVQYMPYHPLDYKVTNGHEHDTESVLMVVLKDGSPKGKLQAMETRFHIYWYQYAADPAVKDGADNVDGPVHLDTTSGRPMVYVQMVGHGFCGGFSPRNDAFPDLQLTCNHGDTPHIATEGVIYSPDAPAQMPTIVSKQTVNAGYTLVELQTSMWPHIHEIGAGKAFGAAIDFKGERCNVLACPTQFGGNYEGNEGQSPGEPWAQVGGNGVSADGDQFFDPAYTMSKRFTFPSPFSLDYCFNPYIGVTDKCAGGADGGAPDGGSPADSGVHTEPVDGAASSPDVDGGAPGDGATPTGASSSGCGCDVPGARTNGAGGLAAALLALAGLARATSRSSCSRARPRPSRSDSP